MVYGRVSQWQPKTYLLPSVPIVDLAKEAEVEGTKVRKSDSKEILLAKIRQRRIDQAEAAKGQVVQPAEPKPPAIGRMDAPMLRAELTTRGIPHNQSGILVESLKAQEFYKMLKNARAGQEAAAGV